MIRRLAQAALGVGMAAAFTASAAAQTAADVAAACSGGSNLPEAICACIGDRAAAELTETQRQWYIAALGDQDTAAEAALAAMSGTEAIDVATFLRTSPADCAQAQ